MRIEMIAVRGAVAALLLGLAACASPPPTAPVDLDIEDVPPPPAIPATAAVAAPQPEPEPPAPAPAPPKRPSSLAQALAYADRVRGMTSADLAAEVQRAGDATGSALQAMQLVLALDQGNDPAQLPRAQTLLQRVLAQNDAEARALHPLARLLAAHLTRQRRADEQAERLGRELREARRRIDTLNDRLEAVRAIERSVPTPPRRPGSAPHPAP